MMGNLGLEIASTKNQYPYHEKNGSKYTSMFYPCIRNLFVPSEKKQDFKMEKRSKKFEVSFCVQNYFHARTSLLWWSRGQIWKLHIFSVMPHSPENLFLHGKLSIFRRLVINNRQLALQSIWYTTMSFHGLLEVLSENQKFWKEGGWRPWGKIEFLSSLVGQKSFCDAKW